MTRPAAIPTEDMSLEHSLAGFHPPKSIVPTELLSKLVSPEKYSVFLDGVYVESGKSVKQITTAPIFICARGTDMSTGRALRQVIWYSRGTGWHAKFFPREKLLSAAGIRILVSYDVSVTPESTRELIRYLFDFEQANAASLLTMSLSTRMGWLPDGSFLLPDVHLTPPDSKLSLYLAPTPTFESMLPAWNPAGSWADWVASVRTVLDYPHMMLALYASAAAPLLRILNTPGFVVDFNGETTGGKTTALRLAASVWGASSDEHPSTMFSWDITKNWSERLCYFLHSLPVVLDDTKQARHRHRVSQVVYSFCQGKGAVTSKRNANLSWRTILISSGEAPAISYSKHAGILARVLSVPGKPLGSDIQRGARLSEDMQRALRDNHGHLGRRIIEYLVSNQNNRIGFQQLFRQLSADYAEVAGSPIGRRHARNLACLEVAASIVHQLGVPKPTVDPFSILLESIKEVEEDADHPLSAFAYICEWSVMNSSNFWGRHDDHTPPRAGWAGSWKASDDWSYIGFVRERLDQLLRSAGYYPQDILPVWKDRGWFDDKPRRRVRVGGGITACICLRRSAVENVLEETH